MFIAFWVGWALACFCAAGQGKPISEQELAARLKHYRGIPDLRVGFRQIKWMGDMGIRIESRGELRLQRPDKVTWRVTKPSPLLVRLDGGHIHLEEGEGSDRRVEDFSTGALQGDRGARALAGMIAWLELDAHAIASRYEIREVGPRTFRFIPRSGTDAFTGLELRLSPDGNLDRMVIDEASRDRLEIDFGRPRPARASN